MRIAVRPGPIVAVEFSLSCNCRVSLAVYNLAGKKIVSLVNGNAAAGAHRLLWNPGINPSGCYTLQLRSEKTKRSQLVFLLK